MTQPPNPNLRWRIAYVNACPYPLPQGSQVLFRDTALALKNRGHAVHLVVYGYGVETAGWSLKPEASSLFVHRCARIPGVRRTASGPSLAKPFMDVALVRTLRRVIRDEAIDIVHAHNYEGLIVALAAGKRPIVYHAHNAMADELPYFAAYGKWAGPWLDRTFPKRADHIIAPHARLADYLVTCGCDPAKISVIPPSVDVTAFPPASSLQPPASTMPPVLYTGNLDAYQNLDFLMRVMEQVRKTAPQARLIMATALARSGRAGRRRERRLSVARRSQGVELVDVPDVKRLRGVLAQDCVVVCPRVSWSGYPIKLLNAMAAGKAIVACESAAYPLVREINGLVVPDNDVLVFAQAVLRLLTNSALRSRLGLSARKTAAQHHNPETIAAAIEGIYSQLLGTPEASSLKSPA